MSDSESDIDIDTAKRLFIDYAGRVADVQAQLKPLKKEMKKNEKVILQHMRDNDIAELAVGDFVFAKRETTRFKMTKEDLLEILENPDDVEQFESTSTSFGRSKKRPRRDE